MRNLQGYVWMLKFRIIYGPVFTRVMESNEDPQQ